MTKWQPIETAPRDGQAALVTDGKLRAIAIPPNSASMIWVNASAKHKPAEIRLPDVPEMGALTHWMPLPEPPHD